MCLSAGKTAKEEQTMHFEAIFAGITSTCDVHFDAVDADIRRAPKSERLQARGGQFLQILGRFGAWLRESAFARAA